MGVRQAPAALADAEAGAIRGTHGAPNPAGGWCAAGGAAAARLRLLARPVDLRTSVSRKGAQQRGHKTAAEVVATRVTTTPDALAPLALGGMRMCRVETGAGPLLALLFIPLLPPLPPLSPRRPQPHRSHETSLPLAAGFGSLRDKGEGDLGSFFHA